MSCMDIDGSGSLLFIQVNQMKQKTFFYVILLCLSTTATATNDSSTRTHTLLDTSSNNTAAPSIDTTVPSNNKPLLIKGPTLDLYNQDKHIKEQQYTLQPIPLQAQAQSDKDNLQDSSTNVKMIDSPAQKPLQQSISHEKLERKHDNSSKTIEQVDNKISLARQEIEKDSNVVAVTEQAKKRQEKLKTQAIEEKIQRQNLSTLKQSQVKPVTVNKQAKLEGKEQIKVEISKQQSQKQVNTKKEEEVVVDKGDKKVVQMDKMVKKVTQADKKEVQAGESVIQVILDHSDDKKIEGQSRQQDVTGAKQSSEKVNKNDNRTTQTHVGNNSKVQKAPTQQIKIISLVQQQTEQPEQAYKQSPKSSLKDEMTDKKSQSQVIKDTIKNGDKDKQSSKLQPQIITKPQQKQTTTENIKQTQKVKPSIDKQPKEAIIQKVPIDQVQSKNQQPPQEKKGKTEREVLINKEDNSIVQQPFDLSKITKDVEGKLVQTPPVQVSHPKINQPQKVQSNHGDKDENQDIQNIKNQQKKGSDKPIPIGETRKQLGQGGKEQQPDLNELLEQVKLDMGEKAKQNVIKHLQDQIKQLKDQIRLSEKARTEASPKVEKKVKQHLKQQQSIKAQIPSEEQSEQVMDTSTILVIIVMTFIISIPIFREIKIKQSTTPESLRKQANPASAAEESNQRLELQFTDLDNETGCAIGEPIDQQER